MLASIIFLCHFSLRSMSYFNGQIYGEAFLLSAGTWQYYQTLRFFKRWEKVRSIKWFLSTDCTNEAIFVVLREP
jgi:hypothetical protein